MSEDEGRRAASNEEPEDEVEVEAHHRRAANDEGQSEGEDDVEAHRMHKSRANKN